MGIRQRLFDRGTRKMVKRMATGKKPKTRGLTRKAKRVLKKS